MAAQKMAVCVIPAAVASRKKKQYADFLFWMLWAAAPLHDNE
jgi:hypothetical protein